MPRSDREYNLRYAQQALDNISRAAVQLTQIVNIFRQHTGISLEDSMSMTPDNLVNYDVNQHYNISIQVMTANIIQLLALIHTDIEGIKAKI